MVVSFATGTEENNLPHVISAGIFLEDVSVIDRKVIQFVARGKQADKVSIFDIGHCFYILAFIS